MSKIDEIESRKELKESMTKEQLDAFVRSINGIFSTEFGIHFGKLLIKYCRVFSPDNTANPQQMLEDAGKRKVYLEFIRPYLDKDIKSKLEE